MPTGDAYSSGHLVPSLWDLHMFYLLRPILFRTCRYFTGLCSSNILRYFLDLAFSMYILHYWYKLYIRTPFKSLESVWKCFTITSPKRRVKRVEHITSEWITKIITRLPIYFQIIAMHSVCYCSLPVLRRSSINKGAITEIFLSALILPWLDLSEIQSYYDETSANIYTPF